MSSGWGTVSLEAELRSPPLVATSRFASLRRFISESELQAKNRPFGAATAHVQRAARTNIARTFRALIEASLACQTSIKECRLVLYTCFLTPDRCAPLQSPTFWMDFLTKAGLAPKPFALCRIIVIPTSNHAPAITAWMPMGRSGSVARHYCVCMTSYRFVFGPGNSRWPSGISLKPKRRRPLRGRPPLGSSQFPATTLGGRWRAAPAYCIVRDSGSPAHDLDLPYTRHTERGPSWTKHHLPCVPCVLEWSGQLGETSVGNPPLCPTIRSCRCMNKE